MRDRRIGMGGDVFVEIAAGESRRMIRAGQPIDPPGERHVGAVSVLLALLLVACSGQTQLVVVVETNLEVPDEIDRVQLVVTGPSGERMVAPQSLVGPDAPEFPLTLGVTPAGGSLGPVDIVAVGTHVGVDVVRSAARVTLVPGETRSVMLLLLRGCVGRDCGPGRTCNADGCVAVESVPLDAWSGEPAPFTDPDPCLAMSWDADGDGDGAAQCGGGDCDDTEPRSYGGAAEDCDGIDNDCDGRADEDCDCTPVATVEPCTTECGSTGQRTCETTGWSACALLPEQCNGEDDDCDSRTDEGFLYAPGAEVVVSGAGTASGPRLLFADDHWSIVWASTGGDDASPAGIYFAALDATGAVLTPPAHVAGDGASPDFAWSGEAYGLSWTRRDSSSGCCDPANCTSTCTTYYDRVFTLVFGPDGAPLTTAQQINDDADTTPRVRVVWDGEAFATSHADGSLQLYRFGADNVAVTERSAIPSAHAAAADLVWDGVQYALAYARGDDAYFLRGDFSAGPSLEQLAGVSRRARSASLARTSSGYLEAWLYEGERTGLIQRPIVLASVALDATGVPATTVPLAISGTLGEQGWLVDEGDPPSLAGAGSQVLVTWVDQRDMDPEVYFARVAPDGFVLQPPTRVTNAPGEARTTSAAAGTSGFGVTWTDARDGSPAAVYFAPIACPAP